MFLVPFFDLQNFILLVRTVPFLRKIIFISSYTAKNNYFLLYELIQDLPYAIFIQVPGLFNASTSEKRDPYLARAEEQAVHKQL